MAIRHPIGLHFWFATFTVKLRRMIRDGSAGAVEIVHTLAANAVQ